jgi:hypothetical protein
MSALNGKLDPLLDPDRFIRLLRQAHDAEVADVRKLSETEYEVLARASEGMPIPSGNGRVAVEEPGTDGVGSAPAESGNDGAARVGLRFRRGSRLPVSKTEIPMVGVVSLDLEPETAVAEPVVAKVAKRGSRARPAAVAEPPGEPAVPKKRPSRPRAKKKPE